MEAKKKGRDARLGQHRWKTRYEQAEDETGERKKEEEDGGGGFGKGSLHPCRRSRRR